MASNENPGGTSQFVGGSPVTDPNNPYSAGAYTDAPDSIVGAGNDLDVVAQRFQLETQVFGSEPETSDVAAERPLSPPTLGA